MILEMEKFHCQENFHGPYVLKFHPGPRASSHAAGSLCQGGLSHAGVAPLSAGVETSRSRMGRGGPGQCGEERNPERAPLAGAGPSQSCSLPPSLLRCWGPAQVGHEQAGGRPEQPAQLADGQHPGLSLATFKVYLTGLVWCVKDTFSQGL